MASGDATSQAPAVMSAQRVSTLHWEYRGSVGLSSPSQSPEEKQHLFYGNTSQSSLSKCTCIDGCDLLVDSALPKRKSSILDLRICATAEAISEFSAVYDEQVKSCHSVKEPARIWM